MKIIKVGLLEVLICSMIINLISPEIFSREQHASASKAVESISHSMYKGDTVKIETIISKSKLSSAKKKKMSSLTWEIKNKKIVSIKKQKLSAKKVGTTKITGYGKKKVEVQETDSEGEEIVVTKTKKVKKITIKISVAAKPSLTRTTKKGAVKGKKTASGAAITWYGIPYGASTAGENRWKAPRPVAPWTGTRQATKKLQNALTYSSSDTNGYTGTEDCLYVNVYRPYSRATKLPVLVYLHGGGNTSGSANVDFGAMAAEMGIVIVSVSFRVGAFGFLSHPALQNGTVEENSGNFALLDIRESLRWVQNEISAFGGNPRNVTLSGFSGGARNTLMCLICPSMNGLFQKAFVMSGGYTTSTPEEGKESAENRLAALLVKRGTYDSKEEALQYIKSADDETIRSLFMEMTTAEVAWFYKKFNLKMKEFPQGFTDGYVLAREGFEAIPKGIYNRVPILLGSDASEFSSYAMDGSLTESGADLSALSSSQLLELQRKAIQYGSMLQSQFYIENTALKILRDASHRSLYAFRMRWGMNPSVTDGFYSKFVGAYHGQTKNFLLGTYKHRMSEYSPDAVSSKNAAGREALKKQIRAYVKNFMTKGNPNGASLPSWGVWNPIAGSPKVMYLDADKKKTTSAMSAEFYNAATVFQTVSRETTEGGYKALTESLWKDRFFMPAVVPGYRG